MIWLAVYFIGFILSGITFHLHLGIEKNDYEGGFVALLIATFWPGLVIFLLLVWGFYYLAWVVRYLWGKTL